MALVFDRVSKWIGDEHHVREASFTFETGSFNVLLGRTLAGKTTLLRLMAGLERPSAGRILLGEADVTGIAVRDRNVAMVYQQFINYPNFTVYDNIASPLKVAGLTPAAVDRRVRETAEMLRIEGLLERKPLALSGGQQQRTAMARALVKDADLVLLDEPLVNLDYKLREELRFDMRELFEARRTIAVYASTEPGEALALGGNTTLVHEGRVLQSGVTGDVYRRPNSVVAAHLFSEPPINIVAGRVADGVVEITGGARFAVNRDLGKIGAGHYQFGVRAHHIALQAANDDDLVLEGRVELAEISGSETFLHLNCAGISLVAHLPGIASFDVDDVITVYVPTHKLFVFDARGALRVAPSGPAVGVASG